jgi:hypothetical protein
MSKIRFVGLDVHADTIAVAVAEADGEVHSFGGMPNRLESIRKMLRKLGRVKNLTCYEAGPTGYVLYWQLTTLGVACEVIAPSLVPVKAGDRVQPDRRDAVKLARSYRTGDLSAGMGAGCRPRSLVRPAASPKTPDRINCEPVTGWESFCCATVADRRKTLRKTGRTNTWTG